MLKNLIATLSFIKNKPSLFHNYLIPDIKPAVSIFIYLRRIFQIKDYSVRRKLADKYKKNKTLNKQGFLNLRNQILKYNLKRKFKCVRKKKKKTILN